MLISAFYPQGRAVFRSFRRSCGLEVIGFSTKINVNYDLSTSSEQAFTDSFSYKLVSSIDSHAPSSSSHTETDAPIMRSAASIYNGGLGPAKCGGALNPPFTLSIV